MRRKDAVGYVATGDPNFVPSQIRQSYIYPPEFYLVANILIEDKEIAQSPGDLLDQLVPSQISNL